MKVVRPHSPTGHILCAVIRLLCIPLHILKGRKWRRAREFEENPRTMRFRDILYFAYKYYYRSPLLPSTNYAAAHFSDRHVHSPQFDKVLATVSIGGDLMPYELIKPSNTDSLWKECGEDFFGSDLVYANLETPLMPERPSSFVPEVMLYDMHFNTDEMTFGIFSGQPGFKGYDILSVANNHSLDQGKEGVDATIRFLKKMGVAATGAKLYENDPGFVMKEVNGIRIGLLAWTYSLNQFELPDELNWKIHHIPLNVPGCNIEPIVEQVRLCREAGAELIILSLHCGNAYQAYPSETTIRLFERVFHCSGADIIAGTHPHNLQPWRSYSIQDPFSGKRKDVFAIYSLGDFVAWDIYTWCHLCAYLKIEVGRNPEGDMVFRPLVRTLIMDREGDRLFLKYADRVFSGQDLKPVHRDLKVLYDICMPDAGHQLDAERSTF